MPAVPIAHRAPDEHVCVITLVGEIDYAVAGEIAAAAEQKLDEAGARTVVVDLAQVSFLDAAGIGALVRIQHAACARGAAVRVASVPDRIARLLHLVGLDTALRS